MLTKKQVIDILNNPHAYTKDARQEAVKAGIKILDEIAIAEDAKEHTAAPDSEGRAVFEDDIRYITCHKCGKHWDFCRCR